MTIKHAQLLRKNHGNTYPISYQSEILLSFSRIFFLTFGRDNLKLISNQKPTTLHATWKLKFLLSKDLVVHAK